MTVLDRPRTTWRVVDIVVASVIAAACSVVFIAWGVAYQGPATLLTQVIVDLLLYYPASKPVFVVVYAISTMLSGAVFGFLSWLLVRALARTGALARFAAGRDAKRVG